MRKLLLAMMQLMVTCAWCDEADVVITHAGTYTGVVRSNQDQRSADITYLVKVPEWKRAHVEISGVREAQYTEQQIIKVGIEADGSYRQFIFNEPNDRQTSVDSRGNITIQLMAQCSPGWDNVDKGYYDFSGYWHPVYVKEYYSYFYCNLNYTLKVTYEDVAPDLALLSLTTTPKDSSMSGEKAMLNFTVRNVGECLSADTTATIRDGMTILKQVGISGLAEWGTVDLSVELPELAVGPHELSVDISPVSGETYTSNNRKTVSFLVCNRTPFAVRFNANGGVGTMEDQNFTCGTSQALHTNQYHREGYRFVGWSRTKDGEVAYADGETVRNLTWRDETVVLFALWKKLNYFTFKFNSNGGGGIMESQDVELDVEMPLRRNTFTKEGCVFVGWSTIPGGCSFGRNECAPIRDEAKIFVWNDAGLYKIMCSDYLKSRSSYLDCSQSVISLYAVWGRTVNSTATCSSNLSFTTSVAMPWSEVDTPRRAMGVDVASLDARSFCSLAFAPATTVKVSQTNWISTVVEGPGVVKFSPGAACLRDGGIAFSIDGWLRVTSMGVGAHVDYYSPDVEVFWYDVEEWEIPTGKHLLTWSMVAKEMWCNKGSYFNNVWLNGVEWIPDPVVAQMFVVTYAPGAYGSGSQQTMTKTQGTALTLKGATFTRTGYTQTGWSKNSSGSTKDYNLNASYTTDAAVTLYPYWTANTYSVSYALNSGTHGSTHPTSATYDTAFYVSAPTRSGYTFAGWTVTSGLNTSTAKWGTGSNPSTPISSTSAKCVNGVTGTVYFKNLTAASGGTVALTANWTTIPVGGDPAVVCEIAAEYRTKADIGVVPVEVVNVKEAVKIAVKGLPSGVKFAAKDVKATAKSAAVPANSIYGAPTKSGVYAATVTVTPTDRKSKMTPLVKTLTFVVRNAGEHIVRAACDAAQGSVKGMGVYASGKKVTLKATAAKGWVFSGWYGEGLVSQAASWTFEMPDKDVEVAARFISAAEDKAAICLAVDGKAFSGAGGETPPPMDVEVRVGLYVEWPVAASALSATTVKVSGLPSGLKFTAKDVMKKGSKTEVEVPANTIYGTPKTASKVDKNGKVTPSKVKITVTTAGKSKQEFVLNVTVRGIPAEGTFNGGGEDGLVTLTVAKTGKISGKYLADGKTWTLSAAGFDTWDDDDRMTATLTAKCGKEVDTMELVYEDGCFSSPIFEARRNDWKVEPWKSLAKKIKGQKVQVGEVQLTVGANGAVTAKGAFVTGFDEKKQKDITYSASCSTVLIPTESEGVYVIYLYFPPKAGKFDGFTDVVEIDLGEGQ